MERVKTQNISQKKKINQNNTIIESKMQKKCTISLEE